MPTNSFTSFLESVKHEMRKSPHKDRFQVHLVCPPAHAVLTISHQSKSSPLDFNELSSEEAHEFFIFQTFCIYLAGASPRRGAAMLRQEGCFVRPSRSRPLRPDEMGESTRVGGSPEECFVSPSRSGPFRADEIGESTGVGVKDARCGLYPGNIHAPRHRIRSWLSKR